MRTLHAKALALVLVATAALGAAEPSEAIRIPTGPVVPQPMPGPNSTLRLAADQLLVIDSDVPCLVFASPPGLVSVSEEAGPVKIRGKFVDGVRTETRTFKGKAVFTVEAIANGRVELIVVPTSAKATTDAIRRVVDVDAGQGPIPPPPKPVDPPKPTKSLRVFLIFESADTITAAQRAVLYGKVVEDWLTANCTGGTAGWRRRDKDSPGDADPTMAAMWAAVKPNVTVTPCIAVERDGKVDLINLEATPAKMVEVLNTYKAAKP